MLLFRCCLLACLLAAWVGKAQTPYIQSVQYPYQLPTKTVYDMLISRQGQLYLGTNQGLFRFNGKVATPVPFREARQLDITHLKEDKQGRVWGMNFARQIFYLENDTLRLFPLPAHRLTGGLLNFDFTDNQIWVATNDMVMSFDNRTFREVFRHDSTIMISKLATFENQAYVVSTQQFLIFQENHTLRREPTHTSHEVSFQAWKGSFYCLQTREQPHLLLKWQQGKRTQLPDVDLPMTHYIYHMVAPRADELWLCTRKGAYLLEPSTGKVQLIFPNKNITDIVQDYQGNYWVSTLHEGLWFCPSLRNAQYAPANLTLAAELSGITKFGDDLYLGTIQGHVYKVPTQHITQWKMIAQASDSELKRIIFSPYAPMFGAGWGIFDTTGKRAQTTGLIKDVRFYRQGAENFLFAACASGAYMVNLSKDQNPPMFWKGFSLDTFSTRLSQAAMYYTKRSQRTYSLELSIKQGKFWVGYDDGLVMHPFTGKEKRLYAPDRAPIIAHSLALDAQDRLWVGTFQQGLLVFEGERIIAHLRAGKELKNNHIHKILVEKDKIWIGTEAEIGYIDAQTLQFTDVLAQSGLSGSFAYKDFYPDAQGIWIALPYHILYVPHSSPNQLEALRLLPVTSLGNHTFKAEALHYKNPSKVQIKYRLKGIDKEWQTITEPQAIIRYTHLRKGDYTLEIFAEDAVTHLQSKIQTRKFTVPAHWWETWWFWGLIAILLLAIVGSIAYIIIERNRQKHQFKEQLWISQIKALQSQMNPHFLYNVLNTVQGLVYSDRRSEASEVLGNFSDLMRNTLQISEKPYISLMEEIELLQLYISLEKIRFEDAIDCHIQITFPTENWEHLIPSMLLQPFVENAFKHGLLHKKGQKSLDIVFSRQGDDLQIVIEDNGIGRAHAREIQQRQARKSTGFALHATQQRVELMNKIASHQIRIDIIDKYNEQNEPTGTKVLLYLHFEA